MAHTPSLWDSNTSKNDGVAYSSSAVAYNSTTTSYSSATTALAESGKLASAWAAATKSVGAWLFNPAATTNQYLYDSASHTYDSAVDTYDGVVSGQDMSDQKTSSVWTVA